MPQDVTSPPDLDAFVNQLRPRRRRRVGRAFVRHHGRRTAVCSPCLLRYILAFDTSCFCVYAFILLCKKNVTGYPEHKIMDTTAVWVMRIELLLNACACLRCSWRGACNDFRRKPRRPRFFSTVHPLYPEISPQHDAPEPEHMPWTGGGHGVSDTEDPTLQSRIRQLSVRTFPRRFLLSGLQADVISDSILGFGGAVLGGSL